MTTAPAPKVEAPAHTAPTRPAPAVLWTTTRLRNTDYVSVRDLAKHYDLKAAWGKTDAVMTLSDARGVRFTFDGNQNDFYFDGLRVFVGAPVILHKDSLWVSLLDVIKVVAPLFRPADHLAQLPVIVPQTIVIDPGHGGIDPGKENTRLGLNEKTFTLDVALRLRKILELRGWRVLLVREKDVELSKDKKTDLQLRDDFANNSKADVFLSIHFNAVEKIPSGSRVLRPTPWRRSSCLRPAMRRATT